MAVGPTENDTTCYPHVWPLQNPMEHGFMEPRENWLNVSFPVALTAQGKRAAPPAALGTAYPARTKHRRRGQGPGYKIKLSLGVNRAVAQPLCVRRAMRTNRMVQNAGIAPHRPMPHKKRMFASKQRQAAKPPGFHTSHAACLPRLAKTVTYSTAKNNRMSTTM